MAVSLIALAVAANCKPQFVVWAAILLLLLCAHQLTFLVGLRKLNEIALFLSFSAVALLAIVFIDLRNAVVIGIPLYPISFRVFGYQMPGPWGRSNWDGPDYLQNAPQPVRWLLSMLEYRAFDGRETAYNIDQYQFIPGRLHAGMGSRPSPKNAYRWLLRAPCLGLDRLDRDFLQNFPLLAVDVRQEFSFWCRFQRLMITAVVERTAKRCHHAGFSSYEAGLVLKCEPAGGARGD